jgi:cellulose synthase/poly-beta-1,6-N-acetylglucosamine synthase-like glycosyltransferase
MYSSSDPRVRIVCSPLGKLNARNTGTELAKNEIILAVDADTFYPRGWVAAVTEPFRDPDVVGVAAPSNFFGDPLLDMWLYPAYVYVQSRKMSGRSSAFRKWAWEATGRFDPSKETDIRSLMQEEEVEFMSRLRTVGKVVFVNAPSEHLGGFGYGRGLRTHIP